jgi:hypothetical protein
MRLWQRCGGWCVRNEGVIVGTCFDRVCNYLCDTIAPHLLDYDYDYNDDMSYGMTDLRCSIYFDSWTGL